MPAHLRDAHYPGAQRLGHGQGYSYPHDDPAGVVTQQYAPDAIDGRAYYRPTRHGAEARYAERSERIREILHPGRNGSLPEPAAEAGVAAGEAGKSAAAGARPARGGGGAGRAEWCFLGWRRAGWRGLGGAGRGRGGLTGRTREARVTDRAGGAV